MTNNHNLTLHKFHTHQLGSKIFTTIMIFEVYNDKQENQI